MSCLLLKRAFSLMESVYASFILLIAVLTFRLFHSGMQYFRWSQEKTTALQLASKRMGQIRNWSKTQNGWAGIPSGPDSDYPDYTITAQLSDHTVASPCRTIDFNYTQKRELTTECKQIRLTVSWFRGSVDLVSLVGGRGDLGWRAANPIVISGAIPASVAAATPVLLSAQAYTTAGPTNDMFFSWYVEPASPTGAMATISPSRDGRTATFINQTRRADGSLGPSTGQCRVKVRAVYQGVEKWADSGVINLAPLKLFKHGFTLAEALVSMAILALILGLAASVFVGYTRITRLSSQHEQNQVRGYSVLERIEAEVAGCHTLFAPNPSGTAVSSSLTFDKVDPDLATRLPTPPDFASAFEPRDPAARVQVSYSVSGQSLHRTTWGVANSDEVLLENVLGFTSQFDPPNGVKISLNLSEGARSQIFKGYGFLWARQ